MLVAALGVASLMSASDDVKKIEVDNSYRIENVKQSEITANQKLILFEALKGKVQNVNNCGFVWYDSCGGSHYFEFFKYFSIFEILEEIWSMDEEYC